MSAQSDPILIFCLSQIGCAQCIPIFIENEIDFESFKALTQEDLSKLLEGKLGPQKKILKEIERIRAIDDGIITAESPNKLAENLETKCNINVVKPFPRDEKSSTIVNKDPVIKENSINRGPSIRSQRDTYGASLQPASTTPQLQLKPKEQSTMEKYGFVLPSAGAFATSIAVGSAQKYIIDKIVWPNLFPNDAKPAVATTENLTAGTGSGTSVIPGQISNPAEADFLAKYGNPNDPTPMGGRSMMITNEQDPAFVGNEANPDFTDAGYQDAGAVDYSAADYAAADYGGVEPTVLPDTGASEPGVFDGIIDGIFGSGAA